MVFLPPPPMPGAVRPGMPGAAPAAAGLPSAAAAAGAAAAAMLQRQLAQDEGDAAAAASKGWGEHQTGDGRKFYYHEDNKTSTWEKPEALMSIEERANDTNWREYRIWDGRAFYFNKETKVSCWSMPPEIRRLRGEGSGIDDRQLPTTIAEKRRAFWDLLKDKGMDETWTWKRANESTVGNLVAEALDERSRKQSFAELLSLCMRSKQIEAREKERNAASALERLMEEQFPGPEHLGTTYDEASGLLASEEAWSNVKSDVRRDEVFQAVMERLEEKHQKTRADRRAERVVRLQRLMASDPELRRARLRWKDAAAILASRDELQEEDPPLEALRVWTSLRDIRHVTEHEAEAKAKVQDLMAMKEAALTYRQDRKRRDNFVMCLKESASLDELKADTPWADFEKLIETEPRFTAMREGPGATATELFDEFQTELRLKGPLAYEGVTVTPKETVEAMNEVPHSKRARTSGWGPAEPAVATGVKTKEELLAAAKAAVGAQAAVPEPMEEDDTNALDELIASATSARVPIPAPVDAEKKGADGSPSGSDAEDDEEDDPLMGVAAKAAAEKAEKAKDGA